MFSFFETIFTKITSTIASIIIAVGLVSVPTIQKQPATIIQPLVEEVAELNQKDGGNQRNEIEKLKKEIEELRKPKSPPVSTQRQADPPKEELKEKQPALPVAVQVQPQTPPKQKTFTLPSGAVVDEQGTVLNQAKANQQRIIEELEKRNKLIAEQNQILQQIQGQTIPPPPIPTVTLTSDKSSIFRGELVTLTWNSTNSIRCSASGKWQGEKDISGTETIKLAEKFYEVDTFGFRLSCYSSNGSSSNQSEVIITVTDPPLPTVTLSSDKPMTTEGIYIVDDGKFALMWTSTGADSCTGRAQDYVSGYVSSGISDPQKWGWYGDKGPSGTQVIIPQETGEFKFWIECRNSFNSKQSERITIRIRQLSQ